jgi:HSP20 family protein
MATTETAVQTQNTESTERTRAGVTYTPRVDIWETAEGLHLRADLPGVSEDALDVRLDDRVLTIEGEVAIQEYSNLQPVYTEYRIGNFTRRFVLSDDIDAQAIQARLANGVLDLTLPKAAKAKPRRIAITPN